MRKLNSILLVLFIMMSTVMYAQRPKKSGMQGNRQSQAKEALALTAEQEPKFNAITEKYREEHRKLRADSTIAKEEVQLRKKRLLTDEDTELKAILTETQYAKWLEIKAEREKRVKSDKQSSVPNGGTHKKGNRLEEAKMKEALSLTQDQEKKMRAIHGKYRKLDRDSTLSKDQKQLQRKKQVAKREAEIKSVLNEAQFNKLQALRDQQKSKREATQAERMKTDLALTEAQFTKVKTVNKKFNEKFKVLKSDTTKSMEAEMKKLRAERDAKMKGILTPDQYTKLQALKAEHVKDRKGKKHNRKR